MRWFLDFLETVGVKEEQAVVTVIGLKGIHAPSAEVPPPGETHGPTLILNREATLQFDDGTVVSYVDDMPAFLRMHGRVHCRYAVGRFSGTRIVLGVEYIPKPSL